MVFQAIKDRSDRVTRSANPSIRVIRQDIGNQRSERAIQRAIRKLTAAGFVQVFALERVAGVRRRSGGQVSNLYVITAEGENAQPPRLPRHVAAKNAVRLCHPPGDTCVTPLVGTLEEKQGNASSLRRFPSPPGGGGWKPAPPAPDNGTDPPPGDDLDELAACYLAAETEPGSKAAPLAPVALEALTWLLSTHGLAKSKAAIRIFRSTPKWSKWPAEMLANATTVNEIMGMREFPATYQQIRNSLTAATARALRSAAAGELISQLIPTAPEPDSS